MQNSRAANGRSPHDLHSLRFAPKGEEDESIGVKLLSAIREVFCALGADRLATKELLEQLVNQDTDAPWAGWWEHDLKNDNIKGPGAGLAKYLKRYHIKSRGVRLAIM